MKTLCFLKKSAVCLLCLIMLFGIVCCAEEIVPETVDAGEISVAETEEYAEETGETASELSEEQMEALESLPEGFSREVVAGEMMRSRNCPHTCFAVWDEYDNCSFKYNSLGNTKHEYSYTITARTLWCSLCYDTLQVIDVHVEVTGEELHGWQNWETGAENILRCDDCGAERRVEWPCSHKHLALAEDGNAYCSECGKVVVLNSEQYYCAHSDRTVYYPNVPEIWYSQWDDDSHVKTTSYWIYEDFEWGIDATCNDCGLWLVCHVDGEIDYCGNTDRVAAGFLDDTVMEEHSLSGGVCVCGYELDDDPDGKNPTHYSIALEDTTVRLTPDEKIIRLENPMLIVNWAYTLQDGTAFSYTRLIKADDLSTLTYDLGLAEAPIGSVLESITVIISDVSTLDITVAAKGYGYAQF